MFTQSLFKSALRAVGCGIAAILVILFSQSVQAAPPAPTTVYQADFLADNGKVLGTFPVETAHFVGVYTTTSPFKASNVPAGENVANIVIGDGTVVQSAVMTITGPYAQNVLLTGVIVVQGDPPAATIGNAAMTPVATNVAAGSMTSATGVYTGTWSDGKSDYLIRIDVGKPFRGVITAPVVPLNTMTDIPKGKEVIGTVDGFLNGVPLNAIKIALPGPISAGTYKGTLTVYGETLLGNNGGFIGSAPAAAATAPGAVICPDPASCGGDAPAPAQTNFVFTWSAFSVYLPPAWRQ